MQIKNKIFTDEKSVCEKGTSFAEMNRSACSNDKQGPTKQYNAFKNFHDSETTAYILAAIHWNECQRTRFQEIICISFFLFIYVF